MSEKNKGYLLVFLAGSCWGLTGIFTKGLESLGLDSVAITMTGQFCASLVMIPICLIFCGAKAFKVDKKTLALLVFLGAVFEASYNLFYVLSIRTIGIAIGAALLYTSPIFVLILSKIMLSESIGFRKMVAVFINVLGCTLASTGGNFEIKNLCLIGIFYGVLTGLSSALVTVFGKKATDNVHPFVVTFYVAFFSFASLALIEVFISGGIPSQCFSLAALGYGTGDGLVATAIAYVLFMSGLAKPIDSGNASVIASVEIVVASFVGIVIFKEQLNLISIIGIIIVLLSIILISKSKD